MVARLTEEAEPSRPLQAWTRDCDAGPGGALRARGKRSSRSRRSGPLSVANAPNPERDGWTPEMGQAAQATLRRYRTGAVRRRVRPAYLANRLVVKPPRRVGRWRCVGALEERGRVCAGARAYFGPRPGLVPGR